MAIVGDRAAIVARRIAIAGPGGEIVGGRGRIVGGRTWVVGLPASMAAPRVHVAMGRGNVVGPGVVAVLERPSASTGRAAAPVPAAGFTGRPVQPEADLAHPQARRIIHLTHCPWRTHAVPRPLIAALLAGAVAVPLAAQGNPAPRALKSPDAKFEEPFDQVVALRELANGRVLVTDVAAKAVLLADFRTQAHTQVGRSGQGPGEYNLPGDLIALAGDTTLVVDRGNRRMLVITPDGKMGATITFPEALGGIPDLRGADRQGRLYAQASPFPGGPGGGMRIDGPMEMPDSVPILRWDRAKNTVDTLGKVKIAAMKINMSGGQNSRTVMIRQTPFAAADDWAVGSEGVVAAVRTGDYHVEWLSGRQRTAGRPVAHTPVRINDAEKEAWLARARNNRNRITVSSGGPGRAGPSQQMPEAKAEDFEWPEAKPAFTGRSGNGPGSWMAPEGTLWVQRSTSVRDSTPTYDVFDRSGNLKERVTLPMGRRMVGIGNGTLYAIATDEDGLQYLERYRR